MFRSVADAHVSSDQPNKNLGSAEKLLLSTGRATQRAFVRFDLAAIPKDAFIVSANLFFEGLTGSRNPANYEVRAATKRWNERPSAKDPGVTFANQPPTGPVALTLPANVAARFGGGSGALRDLVQAWVRNPGTNFGLGVELRAASSVSTVLAARERGSATAPRLTVNFRSVRIDTSALPAGRVGEPYDTRVRAKLVRVAQVEWRLLAGRLPAGLLLSTVGNDLRIAGTPREAFDAALTFEVKDATSAAQDSRVLRLRVRPTTGALEVRQRLGLQDGAFAKGSRDPLLALHVELENDSDDSMRVQKLNVFVGGSGDNGRDLSRMEVVLDANRNGRRDPAEVVVGVRSAIRENDFTQIPITGLVIPPKSTRDVMVLLTPSGSCPSGAEFSVNVSEAPATAEFVGSATAATIVLEDRIFGRTMVCDAAESIDADADGDGAVDVRDVQRLARAVGGSAAGLADPNGSGVVEDADVTAVLDTVLARPVLVQVPRVVARGELVVVRGFDLGTILQSAKVQLGDEFPELVVNMNREKVFRAPRGTRVGALKVFANRIASRAVQVTIQ